MLPDGPASFPRVSQKFLKGAAARMMVYFMRNFAAKRFEESGRLLDKVLARLFSALCALQTIFAENPIL